MWAIILRYLLLLITVLRYFYNTLLGLGIDKLLHLAMAHLNSFFEKIGHFDVNFEGISSKISELT